MMPTSEATRNLQLQLSPRGRTRHAQGVIILAAMRKIKTTTYQFPVIIEKDEAGFFVADCPDLAGCHTQGRTIEEAIANIRDAIKLHLRILKEDRQEVPKLKPVSLTSLEVSI